MILTNLYPIQKDLDERINKQHELQYEDLTQEVIIAIKVELGELLNEVRAFKFWSNKQKSPDKVILEELVDILHFLLSFGLRRNYSPFVTDVNGDPFVNWSINELSVDLFANPLDCTNKFHRAIAQTLAIGFRLGFSEQEIYEGYLMKNKINHERQDNDY